MTDSASPLLKAVTFDAGGTLIEPWPSVGHVYARVAQQFGIQCIPEEITAGFFKAWSSRKQFGYSRAEWFDIVRRSFNVHIAEHVFHAIYHQFAQAESWRIYHDVLPVLQWARDRNLKLAVISNWDERLKTLLEQLGLAHWFDLILISAELGFHKPDPAIFKIAADRFNIPPHEMLHIGDSEQEDLKGAASAGMHSILIDRRKNITLTSLIQRFSIPTPSDASRNLSRIVT